MRPSREAKWRQAKPRRQPSGHPLRPGNRGDSIVSPVPPAGIPPPCPRAAVNCDTVRIPAARPRLLGPRGRRLRRRARAAGSAAVPTRASHQAPSKHCCPDSTGRTAGGCIPSLRATSQTPTWRRADPVRSEWLLLLDRPQRGRGCTPAPVPSESRCTSRVVPDRERLSQRTVREPRSPASPAASSNSHAAAGRLPMPPRS